MFVHIFRRISRGPRVTLLTVLFLSIFLFEGIACAGGNEEEMLLIPVRIDKGSSLIQLTREYCTSKYHWKEIARINKLTPPYKIYGGDIIRIPFELLKRENTFATVASVSGPVMRQGRGGASLGQVKKGDEIRAGETLITGDEGFVYIVLSDNRYIRVSSGSKFSFTYLFRLVDSSLKAEFFLERGNISVDVQRKLQENETVRTRTPFAITGVRGTFYRVKIDEDVNIVETLRGLVTLSAADSEIEVKEGTGSVVKKGAPPTAPQVLPAPLMPPRVKPMYRSEAFHIPAPLLKDGYGSKLRICTDEAGEESVWEGDSIDGVFSIVGLVDGQYYAFFTAVNPAQLESRPAGPVAFGLRTTPGPPMLSSRNGGLPIFGTSFKSSWLKGKGDAHYLVQVAEDENFSAPVVEKEVETLEYVYKDAPAGTYYFRVLAVAEDGFRSNFSRTEKVVLKGEPSLGPMPPPSSKDDVILRWPSMGEGILYDVEIAKDKKFSKVVERGSGLENTEYKPQSLEPGEYWVRMRGVLATTGEMSSWTSSREIVVPSPEFSWIEGVALGGFILLILL